MFKTIKQRLAVLGILVVLFLAAYGLARHYSPAIVGYVVEQALFQKAPEGFNPSALRHRYESFLASFPPDERMNKIMALSSYLEKVQQLTEEELERLLPSRNTPPGGVL